MLNISDDFSFAKKRSDPETVQELAAGDPFEGDHFESHAVVAARAIMKAK